MNIRKATQADVDSIVKIHIDAFDGFFLATLGTLFLKFYYTCFINNAQTVTMIAEEGGIILGFSASTKVCKNFNRRLIGGNFFVFCILSIKLLCSSPRSLIRLMKNLTKKGCDFEDNEEYAELYSIGINKNAQGRGIGKKLLSSLEQVMKEEGVQRLSLTTDFYNNESSVGFYHSMGYEILYEFVTYPNRKMYRLIKNL